MVPGTVARLRNHIFVLVAASKGPHKWIHAQTGRSLSHEQFAARMRGDTSNLPVILFDPLDTDTDKGNNNGPLIKAFVKTLEEANIITLTQFHS